MKKILVALIAILVIVLCAGCTRTGSEMVSRDEPIGYAIVIHEDGEEHIPVYSYSNANGVLTVYTDGDTIVSNAITLVIEED